MQFRASSWGFSVLMLIVSGSLTSLVAQNSETEESEALPWEKGALQLAASLRFSTVS